MPSISGVISIVSEDGRVWMWLHCCVRVSERVWYRGGAGLAADAATLGGDWVCFSFGSTLGGGGVVEVRKMVASCCSAASRSSPSLAKGAAGAGLRRASIKSRADLAIVLVEDRRGIGQCSGKNSTVPQVRSAAVLVT